VNPLTFAILTISVIGITFSANPLPLQQLYLQNVFAQDDESQTGIYQRLGQKNLGSGESDNFNCAENMIKSASDSIECIPSGPTPPTPPPPVIPFIVSGEGSGTLSCNGGPQAAATIEISVQGDATGTVGLDVDSAGTFLFPVTGGPDTEGITFSLAGRTSPGTICGLEVQSFTVSGVCGNDVTIFYEEPDMLGSFTGDVECTLV
jgi:hypothetical protein